MESSREKQRQQKIPEGSYHQEEVVNTQGTDGVPSLSPAQTKETSREESCTDLMEWVVSRDNIFRALHRVEANKGVPGIDGMTTESLRPFLKEHWPEIREKARVYQGGADMADGVIENIFLVSAPAGSGKITTIKKMIVDYTIHHLDDNILCITYTNRASDELKKGLYTVKIHISTIHSFLHGFMNGIVWSPHLLCITGNYNAVSFFNIN